MHRRRSGPFEPAGGRCSMTLMSEGLTGCMMHMEKVGPIVLSSAGLAWVSGPLEGCKEASCNNSSYTADKVLKCKPMCVQDPCSCLQGGQLFPMADCMQSCCTYQGRSSSQGLWLLLLLTVQAEVASEELLRFKEAGLAPRTQQGFCSQTLQGRGMVLCFGMTKLRQSYQIH